MERKHLISVVTLFLLTFPGITNQIPLVDNNRTSSTNNETIADLVQRQTDAIKKIVSNHHPMDYAILNKYQPDNNKKQTVEDLKVRCEHLMKLFNTTTTTTTTTTTSKTTTKRQTHRPINGFYVTTETPSTKKPSQNNVKYIKLEPVILQKTILSDGRTIYYWHRSVPGEIQSSSTPPTTTTTTTSGYSFRDFFPSFGSFERPVQTATEKTTTTPSTTVSDGLIYKQQLKFVVPVPFLPPEEGEEVRGGLDQFAYYPKQLQPEVVKVEVPYVPTFHVIKALAIPNQNAE